MSEKEFLLTANIESAARDIAEAEEFDIDVDLDIDRRAVGRTMSKLRFEHGSEGLKWHAQEGLVR
ncbi:MAG: hypothetical protein ACR2LM_09295 [Pyrinomonadaceae bacterium]